VLLPSNRPVLVRRSLPARTTRRWMPSCDCHDRHSHDEVVLSPREQRHHDLGDVEHPVGGSNTGPRIQPQYLDAECPIGSGEDELAPITVMLRPRRIPKASAVAHGDGHELDAGLLPPDIVDGRQLGPLDLLGWRESVRK
jgi:hypothetical protein